MIKKPSKDMDISIPVEKHTTAAWAATERSKPVSKTNVPPGHAADEAKGYVDENQK